MLLWPFYTPALIVCAPGPNTTCPQLNRLPIPAGPAIASGLPSIKILDIVFPITVLKAQGGLNPGASGLKGFPCVGQIAPAVNTGLPSANTVDDTPIKGTIGGTN
jgi:hypothetical protein